MSATQSSTTGRPRRRHPASRARVITGAVSVAGVLGLTGCMAAAATPSSSATAVTAAATTATTAPSTTTTTAKSVTTSARSATPSSQSNTTSHGS